MGKKNSAKTVTREDAYGNKIEVPVGADGKNPVSPENPPVKAQDFMSEDAYARPEEEAPTPASEEDSAPAKSAPKSDWVAYAVTKGADATEAEDATKEDLISAYGN